MKRWVVGLGLLTALALAAGVWLRSSVTRPASLLLVTIDTLRADRVGAYGSVAALTPAFDAIAARGWLFEQAVSAVPLTLPAHATMLSGLEPFHHGVRNNGTFVFPQTRETLATRLKGQGYATGAFISAVVLDRRFGLARGFDVYNDQITRVSEGRSVLESERSCDAVSENAVAWLRSRAGPFFLWVHIYEPHAPYAPPSDMARAHPGSLYDAEVATADRCLAGLVAAAQAAEPGQLVTAVTSDHGEGLGDHGESTHGMFLYQSTLRVPMVIAGPGVPEGKRSPGLARSADLAPTLLGILGAPELGGVDGKNLLKEPEPREAYAESDYSTGFGWAPLRSWRSGDLKLIDAPKVELYDLARDPREERNLAALQPKDVERVRLVLRAALASEVRRDERHLSAETEERLRSLGYVAGALPDRDPKSPAALDPKDALPFFQGFERAMEAESRGDLGASRRELAGLTRKDPTNLTFHRSLASVLRRSSRPDEAIRVLKAALKLAARDAAIAHDLGVAFSERGRVDQAIEIEERAVALDPAFVDALDHLASLYARRGDLARARAAVDRALALDANHARAWSNRGNIARAQGQAAEAEQSYGRALGLAPDLAEALNGLGVLAVEKGRLDEAAERLSRALELDPTFDEARLNLAVVEAERGHTESAILLASQTAKDARDPGLRTKARSFLSELRAAPR